MTSDHLTLRTSLCDLLGIEYPILQSGMGLIAGTDLVASVSESGGLGIVAGFMVPADKLREAFEMFEIEPIDHSGSIFGYQQTCAHRAATVQKSAMTPFKVFSRPSTRCEPP